MDYVCYTCVETSFVSYVVPLGYKYATVDAALALAQNSDCNTSLAFWLGIEACTPEDFEYDPPVPVGCDKVEA